MNGRKQEYRVGIGAASMLMIFIILCLTTLAILALSSARTDRAMTARNVQILQDYYEAVNGAQSAIARADEALKDIRERAEDEEQYARMLRALNDDSRLVARVEGYLLSFSVNAGNDSTVDIILQASAFSDTGPRYRVVKHALSYIDNWEPESDLTLYTGDYEEGDYEEPDDELILD